MGDVNSGAGACLRSRAVLGCGLTRRTPLRRSRPAGGADRPRYQNRARQGRPPRAHRLGSTAVARPPAPPPPAPATLSDRYARRGVSARKEAVQAAVAASDPGLFPRAFCKVVPDVLGGDPAQCLVMHADGAGTKSALAYLQYRETGDPAVFRGIAQDALVMNVDDMLCVGCLGPFAFSNTIGRNARLVPGEVIRELIAGFEEQAALFARWGIGLRLTGGETADVGDLVRTVIVDSTAVARMARADVIQSTGVRPGHIIVGLASFGQTSYEPRYNSGIGSNGLTSARHDLLHAVYGERYPETVEPGMPAELRYSGPFRLGDPLPDAPATVGEALLAPTRTYAPVIAALLAEHRPRVAALVHCTGGGQTKTLRAGEGIHFVKDAPFPPPPVFATIQRVTGTPWRDMYQVFNMGHRMEVIGDPALLPALEALGREFRLEVRQVGHCEASPDGRNRVTLHTPGGVETFE
ncbi:MAG: phosphoribosylformylglycinamidine cyclo-ligase [Candidatus Lambdaproteobacteria bacterium]|nr:phosphoribosylformylglycinamidine cyclo-ligase [Candidatus Lambdaproteobacteria bacterium]